jgi:hypothetical protein
VLSIGGRAPLSAKAAEIFENAALVAEQTPTVTPRPDQFVYVESATAYREITTVSPETWVITEKLRRIWRSVDGTGDGLLRERPEADPNGWSQDRLPGCVDGKFQGAGAANAMGQPCSPQPAYDAGLPTDPAKMYDYLYRNSHGNHPADEQAFITVGDMIRENYVPPKVMAAMFRAAAKIHGTTVMRDVVDPAGRKGIAVAYTAGGSRRELIFDPKTYEYLGEVQVAVKNAEVIGGAARLTVAIVDQPGQLK